MREASLLKKAEIALLTAASFWLLPTQAGVVIGGTRFVYPQDQRAISVTVRNKSSLPYLIGTKIYRGGRWPGAQQSPEAATAWFTATPPLFALQPGRENKIRLFRADAPLPADRETLFTLSIASIPASQRHSDNVQMAVRSSMKFIYRPEGLQGEPALAYRQLRWQLTADGLTVENPSPYYVTLYQLSVNGTRVDNAGVVAPLSQRQTDWCKGTARCQLTWQSLSDEGRILPSIARTVK
ncbi:TPA: fimbria/pilus periplasmic chaperone [Enterobacter hormaechei]|nr:fimbria/pilus periplasmic chaperone [Enterobacter hormaechei]